MKAKVQPLAMLLAMLLVALPAQAQEEKPAYDIQVETTNVTLEMGTKGQLSAKVVDADGVVQEDMQVMFFSRSRRALAVDRRTGEMEARKPGTHNVMIGAFLPGGGRVFTTVTVDVPYPQVEHVSFANMPSQVYAHTRVPTHVEIIDAADNVRDNVDVMYSSSDEAVASVDAFGNIMAHAPGTFTLSAVAEGIRTETTVEVVPSPIASVKMISEVPARIRTGDVVTFRAAAYDANGNVIDDAPIHYAVHAQPDDNLAPAASGQIEQGGRFVADTPGRYTVIASTGMMSSQTSVYAEQRNVTREVELVGHGAIVDVPTSDLWVWEGVDGRDYAVTGTHVGNGEAYFWDVTDAANPTVIDTVTVDARVVNDVKVNEKGDLCVISREGASSRRNGIVILDCTDPANVEIISTFDENLTGGVHNVFIYEGHVYALSAGQRFDVINIEDPKAPHRVGSFELDTPGHSIHDVWVVDGIAYTSNWSDGVWAIDVGNGIKGGSPSNPVAIGHYAYPSGWNHAAFPYHDKETGKFYIIAGDESSQNGRMAGWIHFIDFTNPENPQEVARYEVPEAGTHNLWVEDDKLYIAYYQGGLRVVDISGDLMGDLYRQGREIARYYTQSRTAFRPNAPMAWGPQPFKGNIFVSDMNSGLWVVKLKGDEKEQKPGT